MVTAGEASGRLDGFVDRADSLRELGLLPAAEQDMRVMVPPASLDRFESAVDGLRASGFSMPLQRPYTQEEHAHVNKLFGMKAISEDVPKHLIRHNSDLWLAELTERTRSRASAQAPSSQSSQGTSESVPAAQLARPASQPNLNAQGTGANLSSAGGQTPTAATLSQPQGTPPAANMPAVHRAPWSRSMPDSAAVTRGGHNPLSSSVAVTNEGGGNATGVLNVEPNNGGVNPHNERRGIMARVKGSDYFPQRGLAYVFLGALGYTGYWAAERMMYVSVKMQDPKQPRSALVTSMLGPFIVFALAMRIYLQLNKETKQVGEIATMQNRLERLEAGRNASQEAAAPGTAGPHNV